jgi:hypothetical protein
MLCQKGYRRTFETRLRLFRRSARRTGAKLCLGNGLANGSFRPGLTQWAKDSKELKPKPYSGASANTGSIRGAVSERVYLARSITSCGKRSDKPATSIKFFQIEIVDPNNLKTQDPVGSIYIHVHHDFPLSHFLKFHFGPLRMPFPDHRNVLYHRAHLGPEFRRKLRLKADAVPHARGHRQDDVIKRSPVAP